MKRVLSAIAFCLALLLFEGWILLPSTHGGSDVISELLKVPAPPPPNPLVPHKGTSTRPADFYSSSKPPSDDASIDDLMDYWSQIQRSRQTLTYAPEPSDRVLDRLFKEIDKDPTKLPKLIGSLPDGERSAQFVKTIYDHEGTTGAFGKDERKAIKEWLLYHSPYFSDELYRLAQKAGDTDTYVTNQEELLALTRVDFDKAKPLIDRLYANGSDKVSKVLARWALYRHALDSSSLSDIERYRDELKSVVEDKTLPGPMRDLAMDALVSEKEWPERDDWYTSLLSDETLGDLGTYTGLTTLINVSPEEKYVAKMLELLKSDNKAVRTAAVRNLLLRGNAAKPEVIKAMLPWLDDPNWANDVSNARSGIVLALSSVKMPESVAGLIRMLDERKKRSVDVAMNAAANAMANAANTMVVATNTASRAVNAKAPSYGANAATVREIETFEFRSAAITALAFQADSSAAPALRRLMTEMSGYERYSLIEALIKCKGFSVSEQVDAFEAAARKQVKNEQSSAAANPAAYANTNVAYAVTTDGANSPMYKPGPLNVAEIRQLIGERLLTTAEVDDDLVYAVINRIHDLDSRDSSVSTAMRTAVLRWPNLSVNLLFLQDLKNGRIEVDSAVRLLAMRRELRSRYSNEVFEVRTASPTANAFGTCLIEDTRDYDAILAGDNNESKAALLACARLIRAPLPVENVAQYVTSADRRLALAAERYLESEDSAAARAIVLGLHPGEAKILGATTGFYVDGDSNPDGGIYHSLLFASIDPNAKVTEEEARATAYGEGDEGEGEGEMGMPVEVEDLSATEKNLQTEVKHDDQLLGVYAFDRQYVRIYKDRVMFSWDEDQSRYRERQLTPEEFEGLKLYLADRHVEDMAPFLECDTDPCTEHELLMLGRNGGRRVYTDGGRYEFFDGLEKIFADMKRSDAVIKYSMSREISGLEILLADESFEAQAVWKEGSDMRVAVLDKQARKRAEDDIDKAVELAEEKGDELPEGAEMTPSQALRLSLTRKHQFDGGSWRSVVDGRDAGTAAQPVGFTLFPVTDGNALPPSQEQWKARTETFELRASEDGIFKVVGGKSVQIAKGGFSDPVVTPNGKWAIAHHALTGEENDSSLVRINLLTGRVYPIKVENYREFVPKAYIASINKVLVAEDMRAYYQGEVVRFGSSDIVQPDPDSRSMMLLDPDTGVLQDIVGTMGPIAQQTFRPLQKAGKVNEFWAAVPDAENKLTRVGIFNTNDFGFKQLFTVPKILFNSMSMWADEPGGKLYFVYRGHLLSLPLKKQG